MNVDPSNSAGGADRQGRSPLDRLAAVDPMRGAAGVLDPVRQAETRNSLLAAIAVRPQFSKRRGLRFGIVAGVAAVVLASAGVAVALVGPTGDTTESPRGELGDGRTGTSAAVEIKDEIAEAMAKTPLPPGAKWDQVEYSTNGEVYSRGVFTVRVQSQAECKWYRFYQDATAKGDQSRVRTAAATISGIPTWDLYRDRDAEGKRLAADIVRETATGGSAPTLNQHVTANCG